MSVSTTRLQSIIYSVGNRCPWLGTIRRYLYALIDVYSSIQKTYSQHREDIWFKNALTSLDADAGIYVDVGGNHPTRLSNTYLLYRSGYRGLIIEPNIELARLQRRFRRNDTVVAVGCGAQAALAEFKVIQIRLAEELAVEPAAETMVLFKRIQAGETELLAWPVASPAIQQTAIPKPDRPEAASPPVAHNLPPQPTPFVGRLEELAEISRL